MVQHVPSPTWVQPPSGQRDGVARAHAEDPFHEPTEEGCELVGVRGHGRKLADHLRAAQEGALRRLRRALLLRPCRGEAAESLRRELEGGLEAVQERHVADSREGVRAADCRIREEVRELRLLPEGLRPWENGGGGGVRERWRKEERRWVFRGKISPSLFPRRTELPPVRRGRVGRVGGDGVCVSEELVDEAGARTLEKWGEREDGGVRARERRGNPPPCLD